MLRTLAEVETLAYRSYMRLYPDIPKGLDRDVRHPELTRRLLDALGAPDRTQRNILITGSKGKGSVAVLIARLLVSQGYRTGLFTSPHLQHYKERIRIDGKALTDEVILSRAGRWADALDALEEEMDDRTYIGPVGATAVLAMSVFEAENTDYNVVELGRGARYDDVNQIEGCCALINSIFVEHADHLGATLEMVAHNKAGILQRGMVRALSAAQNPSVQEILQREASEQGVAFETYGRAFRVGNVRIGLQGTLFDYMEGDEVIYRDIQLGMLGEHQAQNAALAIRFSRSFELLHDEAAMRAALAELTWMGRLEILQRRPWTVLDGCIAPSCIAHVLRISEQVDAHPVVCVVGIPEEKDYLGVVAALRHHFDHLILTHATNDFLKFSERQVRAVRTLVPDVSYVPRVREACERADQLAGMEGKILYIGTQSLIKDVKTEYGQDTLNAF